MQLFYLALLQRLYLNRRERFNLIVEELELCYCPNPLLSFCIHYVEGKEGFLCMDVILTAEVMEITVVAMEEEEEILAVQHSF